MDFMGINVRKCVNVIPQSTATGTGDIVNTVKVVSGMFTATNRVCRPTAGHVTAGGAPATPALLVYGGNTVTKRPGA